MRAPAAGDGADAASAIEGNAVLGVDQWIGGLAAGGFPAVVLVIDVLLGLRHASDPGLAGLGLLLLAPIQRTVFAAGAAVSMATLSACAGLALARPPVRRRLPRLIPAFVLVAAASGVVYTAGALA